MSRPRALPLKRFLAEGRERYTQSRIAANLGVGANYLSEVLSGLRPVPNDNKWVRFLMRRYPEIGTAARARELLGFKNGDS